MSDVKYEKRDRVGYITLNRPEALNALDDKINGELWEIWKAFSIDDSVDVAILTGEGKAFCSGADLKTLIPKWEKASMLDLRRNVATGIGGGITRGQHRMTKPVIAAVNGYAIGAGFELALACDIRIASEKAKFGVFEVRYRLHQGDGRHRQAGSHRRDGNGPGTTLRPGRFRPGKPTGSVCLMRSCPRPAHGDRESLCIHDLKEQPEGNPVGEGNDHGRGRKNNGRCPAPGDPELTLAWEISPKRGSGWRILFQGEIR